MDSRLPHLILLAVADEELRRFYSRVLTSAGHKVLEASNGGEAEALSQSNPPALVLLGVRLPNMDSIALCRCLKTDPGLRHPQVMILFGADDDPGSLSRILESGTDDCLALPVTDEELLARVQVQLRLKEALDRLEREVEAHRATQAELLQSERTLRLISEAIHDVLWLVSPPLDRVVYLSPAYETIWGRDRNAVYRDPRSVLETVHPEDRPEVAAVFADYARGISRDHQYRIVRPDGTLRWIHESAFLIHDAGGRVALVAGISRDVTVEKQLQAETVLRESEVRLRELAENLPQVVWIRDRDRIIYVNPAYEKILGVPQDDLYQSMFSLIDHVHPEDRDRVRAAFRAEQQSGSLEEEFRIVRPDGALRWIHARSVPICEGDKVARFVGIADDITQRKEAEEALRISEAKLRQGQEYYRVLARKLIRAQEEERRRLARELHDDLTQRMAYLAMEMGMLTGWAGDLPDELRCRLAELREYSAELAEDVNDLSRLLHPALLDELTLVEALRTECRKFEMTFDIRVHFQAAPSLPDPGKEATVCLYRLLQEALRNVHKHAMAKNIAVALECRAMRLTLTITDDGIGFDPETARKKGGIGLVGMSERLALLDGRLTVEARPGAGTTIRACLPCEPGGKGITP